MNSRNLFDIIGNIDERLITEADIEADAEAFAGIVHNGFTNINVYIKAAVIAAVMIIGGLGMTFAVNAEFRHAIIKLFQLHTTEVVPDNNAMIKKKPAKGSSDGNMYEGDSKDEAGNESKVKNQIIRYETDEIDKVFTSSYVAADGYIEVNDGIYVYSKNNKVTFYNLKGENFVPIDTQKIRKDVEIHGIQGSIDYYYCEYKGKIYMYDNDGSRFAIDDKTDGLFSLSGTKREEMWLSLYINPQSDNFNYPVRFNMNNEKTEDFLKDIKIKGHSLWEEEYLTNCTSIDENTLIVSAGKNHDLYRISLDKKTALNLTETMDLPANRESSSYKIIDHYLFLIDGSSLKQFDYVRYDLLTGEKTVVYENYIRWYEDTIDSSDPKVSFTGGKYDLIKMDNAVYVSDEITGEIIPIEGLTDDMAIHAMANSADNKICVSEHKKYCITKLGIIDMETHEFFLLNRINLKEEYALTWQDDKHVAIQAEDDEWRKKYIYLYSLKEEYIN